MRPIIIILIALALTGCLKDDPLNMPFDSFLPVDLNDGLILSRPADEGIDPVKLTSIYKKVYEDENLWPLRSMLVFRNNKLVSEAYLKSEDDISTPHLIWSCTKQVIGILTGIALDKGILSSIDAPLSECLANEVEKHPDKASITLRQLLTMHSGIDYNNDGTSGQTDKVLRQLPPEIIPFILSRPMRNSPGTDFYYNDGDPQLVSAIIQKATGKPTDEWAKEMFFSKIGVNNYKWLRYKDGTTLGGFGIETTPRELAKIAMCVANDGLYNNVQIVSSSWISEMTSPLYSFPDDFSFGYLWWGDTSRNVHFMWGHGGQFAFIVPSKSLVVVMTSLPNTQADYEIRAEEVLPVIDEIISASF
jgi:CubicO group peptidase (beta-lactamase class C family)